MYPLSAYSHQTKSCYTQNHETLWLICGPSALFVTFITNVLQTTDTDTADDAATAYFYVAHFLDNNRLMTFTNQCTVIYLPSPVESNGTGNEAVK